MTRTLETRRSPMTRTLETRRSPITRTLETRRSRVTRTLETRESCYVTRGWYCKRLARCLSPLNSKLNPVGRGEYLDG